MVRKVFGLDIRPLRGGSGPRRTRRRDHRTGRRRVRVPRAARRRAQHRRRRARGAGRRRAGAEAPRLRGRAARRSPRRSATTRWRAYPRPPTPAGSDVIGRLGDGDGPSLLLNGHIDVVPADRPDLWTSPPFEPRRSGDLLFGRGAGDMKGGFAMAALALEALLATDPHAIAGSLTFASVLEEECTGNGTLAAARAGVLADAVILPEPSGLDLLLSGVGILWLDVVVTGFSAHAQSADRAVNPVHLAIADHRGAPRAGAGDEPRHRTGDGRRRPPLQPERRHVRRRRLALERARDRDAPHPRRSPDGLERAGGRGACARSDRVGRRGRAVARASTRR